MRKSISGLLAFVFLFCSIASGQINKPTTVKPKSTVVANDTVNLKGLIKRDTTKTFILVYTVDESQNLSISVLRGYAIQSYVTFGEGGGKIDIGTALFTQTWEAIKPEDVYDVKRYLWK